MKSLTKEDILRKAGLDQTPEQILAAQRDALQAQCAARNTLLGAFLYSRKELIERDYGRTEAAKTIRMITHCWMLYLAAFIVTLFISWILSPFFGAWLLSWIIWGTGHFICAPTPWTPQVETHYVAITLNLWTISLFVSSFFVGVDMSVSIVYSSIFVSVIPVPALIAACLHKYWHHSFPSALFRTYVALFATPAHIALKCIDLWILKHPHHPALTEAPEDVIHALATLETRIAWVRRRYQEGLSNIRKEILGPESDLQCNRQIYAARLETIRTRKQQVALRLQHVADHQLDRRAPLSQLLSELTAREERYVAEVDQLDKDLIPRVGALIAEIESGIQGLDAYLADEELYASSATDAEEDDALIALGRATTARAIHRLGERLYALNNAIQDAVIHQELTDSEEALEETFRRQEAFAKKLAELEASTEPSDTGHAVH